MHTEFSSLPPEPSPEEFEASLLQLAQGLVAAARAWRTGTRATLIEPDAFVRNINAALAGLNTYVRQQDDLRIFGAKNFDEFAGRDATLISIIDLLQRISQL